jgi:molybdopterin synthase sulfur carrier subunit
MPTIRLELPQHLRHLANIPTHEISFAIEGPTLNRILDALEATYPALRGTIRDHHTQQRRPFLRFFACEEDISLLPLDAPLPPEVANGKEPLLIIAGIAGG